MSEAQPPGSDSQKLLPGSDSQKLLPGSDSQKLLPWLNPKEKLVGVVLVSIASAFSVTTLVLTAIFAIPKMTEPPPKDYYPDIVKEKCSTCWEATVFATRSDPFYQWVTSSSLSDELEIKSQRGTIAYQRASIWRVSNTTKNETSLYSSPDPHIFRGVFNKHSRTWVSKMAVNWGISVRLCFTLESVDDSCLYTTPIVRIPKKNSPINGSYAALLIGVPYRRAAWEMYYTLNTSSLYLDNQATYLTNFISNARTGPGLKLHKDKDKDTELYVYEGRACRKASPIFFTPDVLSYLGFPSLQCACSGLLCFIGMNFVMGDEGAEIFPLTLNASGCLKGKSFWDFDIFPEENKTIFFSYSSEWNTSISIQVNLTVNLTVSLTSPQLHIMLENFTSCAERFMESGAKPDSATLIKNLTQLCATPGIGLEPASNVFERYQSRGSLNVPDLGNFFDKKVPDDMDDNALCGLDEGQTKLADNLCMMNLEELKSTEAMQKLERRLIAFSKVVDVKRFMAKQWEQSSSQRSDIVIGIVTAVVTILVTIWGMFSRNLQEVEALLFKWLDNFTRFVIKTVGLPVFKMGIRAMVLLSVMVWNMFNVFRSLKAAGTEPRVAISETLLQQMNDISFLVTTTSTVQVIPQWIIFYAASSVMGFVFVAVVFGVYVQIRYVETEIEKKGKKESERDAAACSSAQLNV